jgi:hypothetical protein
MVGMRPCGGGPLPRVSVRMNRKRGCVAASRAKRERSSTSASVRAENTSVEKSCGAPESVSSTSARIGASPDPAAR